MEWLQVVDRLNALAVSVPLEQPQIDPVRIEVPEDADLLARILRERRARWEAQQLAKFEAAAQAEGRGMQPPAGLTPRSL